jgi:choline dehydrogenase
MMPSYEVDVVVVGAGSSGAVVASRLTENPDCSVALVEAGPDFPDEATDPPAFLVGGTAIGENFAGAGAATPDLDWGIWSEPVADGRRVHLHRGRLVGGSSMVNGCVAVRGAPEDFTEWERAGAVGWNWESVVPFYELAESVVPIRTYPRDAWTPFQKVFADGFEELGFRFIDDLNAPDAWGGVVGPWPQNRRNEIRQGTLVTYVRMARYRPNLQIVDRSASRAILIDDGRATGVQVEAADGGSFDIRARAVVVSAGTYGSPALLQRSGVGPEEVLQELDVIPVAVLPAGENLRDHPQCVFLLHSTTDVARMCGPGYAVVARGAGFWSFPLSLDEEQGLVGVAFGLDVQEPVGCVRSKSTAAWEPPEVDHRYRDVLSSDLFTDAWESFARLAATQAFRSCGLRGGDTGRALADVLAERLATAFHPCGTCAIGPVVDERLRVHGLENVYVADASVFPSHVTNNPNLTCFMIGERAATFVAGDL